jgi:hypothetical protein
MSTPMEKLKIFVQTIITLNYKTHDLFNVFLDEWEFKINTDENKVEELYLFDNDNNIIITHRFTEDLQTKYFNYFKDIAIVPN